MWDGAKPIVSGRRSWSGRDAGEMILREIIRNPGTGFEVEAIFDDDPNKQRLTIHGIKVKGGVEDIPAYVQANPIHLVIVAIPSANNIQMKRIYNTLKNLNVAVKTLPRWWKSWETH
jgi:FlaA1/EpsC-like NDP-sugar epimerase